MDAFSFYFSFYGLILGLSVAQVAAGLGRALNLRREIRIGWLTVGLSAFVLIDIASFWVWAWYNCAYIAITFASIYLGLLTALAYFLAAILLFPVKDEKWSDLDEHYWLNKRLVLLGVGFANVLVLAQSAWRHTLPFTELLDWVSLGAYWVPLVVLMFSRRKALDGACIALLLASYVIAVVLH